MNDIQELLSRIKNPSSEDRILVQKAYDFATYAHRNQKRNNGEPYFNHCFATAKNIAELNMGAVTISAGLLHDVLEDTEVTIDDLRREFGAEILFIIEGVTKLGTIKYQGTSRYNENLRKLFIAMSKDIRVLIVKLCDRLHNIQTLEYVPKEKQFRIAKETLEIYAPLAYRLGIKKLQRNLEDLSFAYVYPDEYAKINKLLKIKKTEQEEHLDKFQKSLKKELAKNDITDFKIDHRVKSLYSLYKKLLHNDMDIEKIYDISALRITVTEIADCYRILGIIHGSWRPLPGRIKDYIASPKLNGYRSIHTTIFSGDGGIIEVQIRTEEMDKQAEFGIATHISYKEGQKKSRSSLSWVKNLLPISTTDSSKAHFSTNDMPHWIKELVEYEQLSGDNFLNDIKSDFFEERIFVFTPIGDVIDLPRGSSAIDFAYSIHSDIGNHMSGVRVNGIFKAIDTILHNGDRVEIETKKNAKPNRKWLDACKTTMAKKHIRLSLEGNQK